MDDRHYSRAHTPAGEALTDLLLAVFRLNGRVLISGGRLVADLGLTSARWQTLGAIALAGTPLPVAHIARNMGLTRQAVQRVANELAADGLVAFTPNPHHRRAKLVSLTAAGRSAYQSALERQAPWANWLASDLTTQEIEAATHVLSALVWRLEDAIAQSQDETGDDEPDGSE